ncbi:hypothetical protein Lser_V15G45466 [Lactuca serriola]
MICPKTFRLHQIRTLLNPNLHTETHLIPFINTKSSSPSSIFSRSVSLSSQFQHKFATQEANGKSKKPLEILFAEEVGLSKADTKNSEDEKGKLKKSLRKLEVELGRYKKDSTKETKSLSSIFSKPLDTLFTEAVGLSKTGEQDHIDDQESKKGVQILSSLFMSTDQRGKSKTESKKVEKSMEFKKLSPDMAMFANFLHSKGYLSNANFLLNNKFDVSCFENNYGRDFLKFAAEKFAKDHRDIYRWLSNGDLKKVAQFGCPSLGRKNVFSSKAMRHSFGIQEEPVCSKCALKDSCKFVNQSVWKKGAKNVDLTVVMRVIILYALEAVPNELKVPDDIKNTVNRLLKEVVRLSEIES